MNNLFGNKFTKYIVNNTNNDLIVANFNGEVYGLPKLSAGIKFFDNIDVKPHLRVVVTSHDNESVINYPAPEKNAPVFVAETNSLLYLNPEDLQKDIGKYGSIRDVVRSYTTGEIGLYVGTGKLVINMSDNPYYMVDNGGIIEIPKCDDSFRKQYMAHHNVTRDISKRDLFIVYSFTASENETRAQNIQNVSERWLEKHPTNILDPIFLDDLNLMVFNNKYAAEDFLNRYDGSLSQYMYQKAFSELQIEYSEDLKKFQIEVKKDKVSIAKTAALMATSTAVGAGVKWLLDRIFAPASTGLLRTTSSFGPMLSIGVGGNPYALFGAAAFGIALVIVGIIFAKKFDGMDKIIDFFNKLKDKIVSTWGKVVGFFKNVGNKIVNGFKAIGRGFKFIGSKIASGFKAVGRGISGLFSKLCFWRR